MCSCLCFGLWGHCDISPHWSLMFAVSERPGYSWSLQLVPGAVQERHVASDTLVLIITVHSPGLLFHWHREMGQSFVSVGYSFIPLPCWVSATLTPRGSGQHSKLTFVRLQACWFLCLHGMFYLLNLSSRWNSDILTSQQAETCSCDLLF